MREGLIVPMAVSPPFTVKLFATVAFPPTVKSLVVLAVSVVKFPDDQLVALKILPPVEFVIGFGWLAPLGI